MRQVMMPATHDSSFGGSRTGQDDPASAPAGPITGSGVGQMTIVTKFSYLKLTKCISSLITLLISQDKPVQSCDNLY
jgi:hypothetical protein